MKDDRLREDMEDARDGKLTLTSIYSAHEIATMEKESIALMMAAGHAGLTSACWNLGRWCCGGMLCAKPPPSSTSINI
jgi:hypothetical protein